MVEDNRYSAPERHQCPGIHVSETQRRFLAAYPMFYKHWGPVRQGSPEGNIALLFDRPHTVVSLLDTWRDVWRENPVSVYDPVDQKLAAMFFTLADYLCDSYAERADATGLWKRVQKAPVVTRNVALAEQAWWDTGLRKPLQDTLDTYVDAWFSLFAAPFEAFHTPQPEQVSRALYDRINRTAEDESRRQYDQSHEFYWEAAKLRLILESATVEYNRVVETTKQNNSGKLKKDFMTFFVHYQPDLARLAAWEQEVKERCQRQAKALVAA